jgi:hypothetical protein
MFAAKSLTITAHRGAREAHLTLVLVVMAA